MNKIKSDETLRNKFKEKFLKAYISCCDNVKNQVLAIGAYVMATAIVIETVSSATSATQTQDLIAVVTNMLTELSGTILRLSTAAALIGVGTGAFFKKLSFGKPDRIETGNKLIVNSIWGWVLLNGLTTILGWAGGHLGVDPEITFGDLGASDLGASDVSETPDTGTSNDLIIGD